MPNILYCLPYSRFAPGTNRIGRRLARGGKNKGAVVADNSSKAKACFPDPKERTPTVLIVEDEALIRMALSDFLQECGFKVLEASQAQEAQEMIASKQSVIDLVFSDVRMPGPMDGFGLSKWIRENRPELPVILASGDAQKSDAAHELCAEEPFLRKPYDLQAVVGHIRAAIEARKASD
jgi:DNA-binding NtrC family response regulator